MFVPPLLVTVVCVFLLVGGGDTLPSSIASRLREAGMVGFSRGLQLNKPALKSEKDMCGRGADLNANMYM